MSAPSAQRKEHPAADFHLLFDEEQNKNIHDNLSLEAPMARSLALTLHSGAARPLPADWRALLDLLPEDLRETYEERAALIEFDGGEKRATAERRAFECVMESAGGAFWGRTGEGAGEKRAAVT
jgi:hypothetical protein